MSSHEDQALPNKARFTCECFLAQPDVPAGVNLDQISSYARNLDVETVRKFGVSLCENQNLTSFELKFKGNRCEAAFIVLAHALDFGGGWRLALHKFHDKGAWLTVKPGVEALCLANPELNASWLSALEREDVAKYFGMESLDSSNDLWKFVELLTEVVNEIGVNLVAHGFETLESWLVSRLEAHGNSNAKAALLVRDLVEMFPRTFRDCYEIKGAEVCFFKKAQLAVGAFFL